ncbi:MAG: hypothetical protein O7D32_02480 [bacterium]|nr:hypothetical protein [bacterium]
MAILIVSAPSWAQRGGGGGNSWYVGEEPDHKLDFIVFGGYVWSSSIDVFIPAPVNAWGNVDFKSSGFYGFEADINLRGGTQLMLLWQRQDTKLEGKSGGVTTDLGDAFVEYWHVGAVHGVLRDKLMPYTSLSLGATRSAVEGGDDSWKFSVMFGLGAKYYINERIGLRAAARLPFTFLNGGVGVSIGSGGVSPAAGGTGMWAFDLSLGLIIAI